jgi:hypothetical protein
VHHGVAWAAEGGWGCAPRAPSNLRPAAPPVGGRLDSLAVPRAPGNDPPPRHPAPRRNEGRLTAPRAAAAHASDTAQHLDILLPVYPGERLGNWRALMRMTTRRWALISVRCRHLHIHLLRSSSGEVKAFLARGRFPYDATPLRFSFLVLRTHHDVSLELGRLHALARVACVARLPASRVAPTRDRGSICADMRRRRGRAFGVQQESGAARVAIAAAASHSQAVRRVRGPTAPRRPRREEAPQPLTGAELIAKLTAIDSAGAPDSLEAADMREKRKLATAHRAHKDALDDIDERHALEQQLTAQLTWFTGDGGRPACGACWRRDGSKTEAVVRCSDCCSAGEFLCNRCVETEHPSGGGVSHELQYMDSAGGYTDTPAAGSRQEELTMRRCPHCDSFLFEGEESSEKRTCTGGVGSNSRSQAGGAGQNKELGGEERKESNVKDVTPFSVTLIGGSSADRTVTVRPRRCQQCTWVCGTNAGEHGYVNGGGGVWFQLRFLRVLESISSASSNSVSDEVFFQVRVRCALM